MKNILITGATGFIGRRVVPLLPKTKVFALIYKKNTPLEISGRRTLSKYRIKSKKIDLMDTKSLGKYKGGYQIVIHMAANTDTANPDHRVNDQGTINLFNSLSDVSANLHFIFISSAAMLPKPTNEYGRSKWRAENFLLQKQKDIGFKLTIIRPTTVYGENPRSDSMFDFIIKNLLNKFSLIGLNWPGKVGLVYVDDVARFIVQEIGETKEISAYNLATENICFKDIVEIVAKNINSGYVKISLPSAFWTLTSRLKKLVYVFEKLFPTTIYNLLWRSTLIVDNLTFHPKIKTLKCSQTLSRFFPNQKSLHTK